MEEINMRELLNKLDENLAKQDELNSGTVTEVSDEELDRQGLEQEEQAPILHDKAIDLLDDMLENLTDEEDRYGEKGDVLRYALKRLQQVGVGR